MRLHPAARFAAVTSLAVALAAAAAAAPPDDAVDVKLAAQPGTTLRFRQTDKSSTEVDGATAKASESSQEYSVAVKAARKDGGLDVEVRFESIRVMQERMGTRVEIDTSKALAADAVPQVQIMDAIVRAMVDRPFTVALDGRGAPTSVTGLREAVAAGVAGTAAADVPIDQMLADEDCMKLARTLFVAAPGTAQAVGSKWTGDTTDEVSGQVLDFAYEATLTSATAADAVVTSKYIWKPTAKATAGGAKAEGTGEIVSKFDRSDGFVLSQKKHLEASRSTAEMKATSHTDSTIERLPAKAAAPEKPKGE